MKDKVLPARTANLELNGMYYGLYCYWTLHGDAEKAADAIRQLMKVAYPAPSATPKPAHRQKLGIL